MRERERVSERESELERERVRERELERERERELVVYRRVWEFFRFFPPLILFHVMDLVSG